MSHSEEDTTGETPQFQEDSIVDSRLEAMLEKVKQPASAGFESLGLNDHLLKRVQELGFTEPSPIQKLAIPAALSGRDLVGISQTGSGKTAAFGLPLLQKLDTQKPYPQALVVCPTRELAVQVQGAVMEMGKGPDTPRSAVLYGGAPIDRQIRDLERGAQLVVGTPGRIQDHLRRRTLAPERISYVVLDEADRMLDMGFRDEVEELLELMSEDRQSLFFSATMNPGVARLIERFAREPQWIEVEQQVRSADTVEQGYYEVRWQSKPEVLYRILEKDAPRLAIIFCNTKRVVDECSDALLSLGFPADKLHGDMTQPMRERVLRRFKDGEVTLLVATDVAGRGLDVDDVDLVINYDLPQDPEDYVHRIGRTGRAGRAGRALTLVARREQGKLGAVRRYSGGKIKRLEIPTQKDLEEARTGQLIAELRTNLEEMGEGERNHAAASGAALEALANEGVQWRDIAGVLFDLWSGESMREIEKIEEDRPGFSARNEGERGERKGDKRGEQGRGGDREARGKKRRERRDRRDRSSGQGETASGDGAYSTTVFVGLGKAEQIRPGELVGMLYNESGAPDGVIGKLKLFSRHALLQVQDEWAEKIVKSGRRARFRGRSFRIRIADER